MAIKHNNINPYKVIGDHPITNDPINLKWMRGASRYNNGATIYGRKYLLRLLLGRLKQKLQANNLK